MKNSLIQVSLKEVQSNLNSAIQNRFGLTPEELQFITDNSTVEGPFTTINRSAVQGNLALVRSIADKLEMDFPHRLTVPTDWIKQ